MAWNTLMSSARHWAQSFSFRPGLGFSPSANAPSITRWVSRPLVVRCTAPGKTKRRWRMVVSTLSHFFFLRTLAYDMRLSVRCRRLTIIIRRGGCCLILFRYTFANGRSPILAKTLVEGFFQFLNTKEDTHTMIGRN